MKKAAVYNFKNFIVILIIFLSSISMYGQKKVVLYLKDGSSLTGYVTYEKKHVKFQKTKSDKKEKLDYQLLDSTTNYISKRALSNNRIPKTYYFFADGKKDKDYNVWQLEINGKVSLYKRTVDGGGSVSWSNSMGGMPNTIAPAGGSKKKKVTIYRVKKQDEIYLTSFGNKDFSAAFITIVDSFKNETARYFEDCPTLVEKIKNEEKGFTRKDMKSIVNYYNNDCN